MPDGDTHSLPHVGGPILPPGCPTVLIDGMPAARAGDMAACTARPMRSPWGQQR